MERLRAVSLPLLGAALALALVSRTGALDAVAREGQYGPGFWPRLVLVAFAAACAAHALAAWRRRAGPRPAAERPPMSGGKLALGVALLLGYVALAPAVGFALATLSFVAAFMRYAGARSWPAVGVAAAAGTVALLYVFVRLVYLPLPKGDGPFEALTLALYRGLRIF